MATVSTYLLAETRPGTPGNKPYIVDVELDFADLATAKGSALAAADIIEAIDVPANTLVLGAGMECTTAPTGGTGTVLDLGITGGDVDRFVDGFAYDSASAGDYAVGANTGVPFVMGASDTIDVLVQAATTVSTAGKVRVWAVLMNIDSVDTRGANEVDRDLLA